MSALRVSMTSTWIFEKFVGGQQKVPRPDRSVELPGCKSRIVILERNGRTAELRRSRTEFIPFPFFVCFGVGLDG